MAALRLHLFGPPRLEQAGRPIDIRPRKALALFVYLAVTGQPHSRDALATMLWPDSDQTAARASLRRTLHRLQRALPEGVIEATGDALQLAEQVDLWIDSQVFGQIVDKCLPAQAPVDLLAPDCHKQLVEAEELFVDEFLAGFTLEDAPEFDDWQFFQQESLRRDRARLLEQLQHTALLSGNYVTAIEYARSRLALDPLHEPAHRRLMELYYWSDQQAAALRQYQECARVLDDELGVPPEDETTALYEAIRTRHLPVPAKFAQPADVASQSKERPQEATTHGLRDRLPAPSSTFVGRATEVDRICDLLANEDRCRFLVLVGPNGIGKSRLAIEVARILGEDEGAATFSDGILSIDLESINLSSDLVTVLAETAGVAIKDGSVAAQQLRDFLAVRQMLLVVDHIEHWQDEVESLVELLHHAPGLKILATSREGVHLQEAWLFPVGSLTYPQTVPDDLSTLRGYDAIGLFEDRARRVRLNFSLEAEADHVVRICQLVEGMPLALELAASWLTALSTQHIADEIGRGLDILTARDANMPSRHRSLRAVLEQSWVLLDAPDRTLFARLSVFRGGFTPAAAQAVAGATVLQLAALADKSLVRLNDDGRYAIHELLRQFAAEQLATDESEAKSVRVAHTRYYIDFLRERSRAIRSARQRIVLDEIAADFANVLQAWPAAVAYKYYEEAIEAIFTLWIFSHCRGNVDDGEESAGKLVAALQVEADAARSGKAPVALLGVMMAGQGWIRARRGDVDAGRAMMDAGIEHLRDAGESGTGKEAFVLAYLAMTAQLQSRHDDAQIIAQQSLEIYTRLAESWGIALALQVLGTSVLGLGKMDEARQILQAALTASEASGDSRLVLLCLTHLGIIGVNRGDYADAEMRLHKALDIGESLGDRSGIASALTYLGNLDLYRGQYDSAEDYLNRASKILQETGAVHDRVTRELLAATYRAKGQLDAAESLLRDALQQAQSLGRASHSAFSLIALGMLASDRRDYRQADQFQNQALQICRETGHAHGEAMARCQLGHISLATGRVSAAQHDYCASLRIARQNMLAPIALECMAGMAQVYRQLGDANYASHILDFVLRHPATTYDTRLRVQSLVAELPNAGAPAVSRYWHATDWLTLGEEIEKRYEDVGLSAARPDIRNLPAQVTPFVGREQEVAGVTRNLLKPACRVLTIVGLGGIGKTRLAVHVAEEMGKARRPDGAPLFEDGVVFVPLASVADVSGLVPAIAEALGLTTDGVTSPRHQLLAALQDKDMLLVLDNFEHLVDGAELINELLAASANVKVLVTSRTALDVPAAWFYPLGGMSFPRTSADPVGMETYEAVQLFAQCAQRARPDFALAAALEPVVQICRLVEGMPLALELVATWLKVLPVESLAQEISRGTDILTARQTGIPRRHRSMRAVIEQSWSMLTHDEQQIFMALAIFRGGFLRQAAEVVAGASLAALVTLVEKSLLSLSDDGRYTIHELLRQFALEKLAAQPQVEGAVKDQFSEFYLSFLESRLPDILGSRQQAALSEIAAEIDNIQLVWDWALERDDLASLERAMQPYKQYLWMRDRGHSGEEVIRRALLSIQQSERARTHPRYAPFHQQLCQDMGAFRYFLGDLTGASSYLEQAHMEAKRLGNREAMGSALNTLGTVYLWHGRTREGTEKLREALAINRELNNIVGIADVTHELARLAMFVGDYATGRERAEESLFYGRQLARNDWIGYAALTVGIANIFLGNFADARRHFEEGLTAFSSSSHQLGMAQGWGAMAVFYWATEGAMSPEVERYAQRSLETTRRIGHRLQVAHRLALLAQFANDRGEHATAIRYADEGTEIAEAVQNPLFLSQNLCYRAEAAYRTNDFITSRTCLARACQMAHAAQFNSRVLLAVYHAAELLLHEATQASLADQERQAKRGAAACLLKLYCSHPASWEVQRVRAHRRLLDLSLQKCSGQSESALPARPHASDLTGQVEEVVAMIVSGPHDTP